MQSNTPKLLEVVEVEGKGLGVVAGESIPKNEFVCEYKYSLSYGREERTSHENEYIMNEEGCYILEVHLPTGKWLCLDATRNFNSFGRLINHSRPATCNLRLHSPLYMREKWRVALYSCRDIEEGEELSYDYGDQPHKPDFMKKVYISNASEHYFYPSIISRMNIELNT